jgi:hypothetical protein
MIEQSDRKGTYMHWGLGIPSARHVVGTCKPVETSYRNDIDGIR